MLPARQAGAHVFAVRAPPHQHAGKQRERVDQRQADESGGKTHHQHTAVRSADADVDLLARAQAPGVELRRFCSTGSRTPWVSPTSMAGSAVLTLAEQLGDLFGQPARALVRPHERLRHRRRHALIEPLGDLIPDRAGVALVDGLSPPRAAPCAAGRAGRAPCRRSGRRCRRSASPASAPNARGTRRRAPSPPRAGRSCAACLPGVRIAFSSERSDIVSWSTTESEIVHGAALVDQLGALRAPRGAGARRARGSPTRR